MFTSFILQVLSDDLFSLQWRMNQYHFPLIDVGWCDFCSSKFSISSFMASFRCQYLVLQSVYIQVKVLISLAWMIYVYTTHSPLFGPRGLCKGSNVIWTLLDVDIYLQLLFGSHNRLSFGVPTMQVHQWGLEGLSLVHIGPVVSVDVFSQFAMNLCSVCVLRRGGVHVCIVFDVFAPIFPKYLY